MGLFDWVGGKVFDAIHQNNLVYNTCWEDPRIDREAMEIGPDDSVMVITSAGCNALDYALCELKAVHAVDMNPRQNALLDLKLAGLKHLDYEDFYRIFGDGYVNDSQKLYKTGLREHLPEWSQSYWDHYFHRFFGNKHRTFYFRGTSGSFARLMNMYIDVLVRVRNHVEELLSATSVDEQRRIYDEQLYPRFWTSTIRFAMNRDTTLSLLGVPRAQRKQVEKDYQGGIVKFIEDSMEAVFAKLPIWDNYFWRVYLQGKYSPDCCPEYLKPDNFERLKNGLADRVHTHTNHVQGFLEGHDEPISRFVLLDHMDWMSDKHFHLLESEWQAIVDRAAPNARVLWRSGGLRTDFVDRAKVKLDGKDREVGELLTYHEKLAEELHERCRVHTYGSFYITDMDLAA